MKYRNIILSGLLIIATLLACNKFDDYNKNPHKPSEVISEVLATKLILDIARQNTGFSKTPLMNHVLSKYMIWTESNGDDEKQYNRFERTDAFEGMEMLINADKMVEAAEKYDEQLQNAYKAVAHFVRAYKFFDLTLRVGDIPYSDAMLAVSDDNFFPKYDTQKDVFIGILNELEAADALLQNAKNFNGDPVYKGDVNKWRKLINSFELKVLINLYKKANDADLKVKERFQALLSKPLFTSNSDNFQLIFSDKAGQKYPFYKEGNSYLGYDMLTSIVIDTLKLYKDNRMFYYAEPTAKSVVEGKSPSDWDSYVGVDPRIPFTDVQALYGVNKAIRPYSQLNKRYSEIPEGEPIFLLSYSDVNFILAEAAARGLITGDAKAYYEEGVKAAMKCIANNTPAGFDHGMPITDAYIATYLQGPKVKFASDTKTQIEQIIMQKYLSLFFQEPWTGFFEMRRTGVPNIPVDPSTNKNEPKDKMPVRWMYPENEYKFNSDNVQEAVQRQFSGNDSPNELMWILQ